MIKISIFFLLITFLLGCQHHYQVMKTGLEGTEMPGFEVTMIDSLSHFSTKSIATGRPSVLFSFDPTCPYCRAETESIVKHIKMLSGIDICMITYSQYTDFKKFYTHYGLGNYPNIIAGIDKSQGFINYFQAPEVPVMAIYDTNKKLKKVLIGLANVNSIKEIAFE